MVRRIGPGEVDKLGQEEWVYMIRRSWYTWSGGVGILGQVIGSAGVGILGQEEWVSRSGYTWS